MTDLVQLLVDLKAAKRGSGALDDSVIITLYDGEMMDWWDDQAQQHQIKAFDGSCVNVTPVTTSIEAALALLAKVLPDFDWIVGHTNSGLTIHAQVGPNEMTFGETPALALCMAIVEAKIKEQES